jgi:uncharacterized protein YndB with AHSA1/START domain
MERATGTNRHADGLAGPASREVTREIDLDATAEEVWRLVADPEELAGWVGDEVRTAQVVSDDGGRRLSWAWAPDGVESTVELTVVEEGDRSRVRVTERSAGVATASARACSLTRWDDAFLALELRALTWTHRLVGV